MRFIEQEMPRFNVTYYDIQQVMNCSEKTVRNKMQGITDFTYSEARVIRDKLFPGMNIEYLFDRHDNESA